MSRDALAGVLRFSQPGAGLFTVRPPNISMTFPNADRLGRGRRAATDQQQPAEVAGPRGGSEPDAGGLQPGATNVSDGGAVTQGQANGAPVALRSDELDRLSVRAALLGNQQAFADLVTRYQSAVYNMAYRMLGDATEAEDAA